MEFTISATNSRFRLKEDDSVRLNEEYQNMLKGLRDASEARDSDLVLANPVLPDDILKGTFCNQPQ